MNLATNARIRIPIHVFVADLIDSWLKGCVACLVI